MRIRHCPTARAQALETLFTGHALAMTTDQAEGLVAGRRRRRIDAVPGAAPPPVEAFADFMMRSRSQEKPMTRALHRARSASDLLLARAGIAPDRRVQLDLRHRRHVRDHLQAAGETPASRSSRGVQVRTTRAGSRAQLTVPSSGTLSRCSASSSPASECPARAAPSPTRHPAAWAGRHAEGLAPGSPGLSRATVAGQRPTGSGALTVVLTVRSADRSPVPEPQHAGTGTA